ncbi:MAG TPA: TIM-barrel domain-containing protein [Polyangia bacterium]|jgi:alpha-glucosidase
MRWPVCFAVLPLVLCACEDAGPRGPVEISQGDTTLRTRDDGSFDLVVGGRTLLQGGPAPVELRWAEVHVQELWSTFTFDEANLTTARPDRRTDARLEGQDLVLSLAGQSATATLRFTRLADEVAIAASAAGPHGPATSIKLHLQCRPRDRFLGFGEQYETIDHRGEAFTLWSSEQGIGRDPARAGLLNGDPWTTYFPVPFFLDPGQGFGLCVDTDARVQVDLCQSDAAEYALTADEPSAVSLHLYTGPTVGDVLRAFTVRQGRSRPAPRWAVAGAWLGVQGGPERVRAAVQTARDAQAAVSAVWVQDWIGRTDLGGGLTDIKYHWTADPTLYPDLPGLIAELHAGGIRFLGYFNPFVLPTYDQWTDAVAQGYLPRDPTGAPYELVISTFTGSLVDLTNPAAVGWFQDFARAALAMGQDGWMGDFGEGLPYDAVLSSGDARFEHNRYPSRWHGTWKDLLDDDKVVFTRSGWLGEGHVAQVVWAGDQTTDWSAYDGLPTVVPALISLGLAGIGFVTHDVAGYFSSPSIAPSTKELYLRWLELAAFTPIFRTHEGLATGLNWTWSSDAETLAAFARWTRVHAALTDTFMQLSLEHQQSGMPIVRALGLMVPDDDRAVTTADQFLIGDDLLVAPVTQPGAVSRVVYFPAGRWISVWDPAETFDGPAEATIAAPLGRPAVFSRSGRADLAAIE